MALRKNTIGVAFPFLDSSSGDYVKLNVITEDEIRSNLIHLLITKKGSRYFMPDFGTTIHHKLFNQLTEDLIAQIDQEIRDVVKKYMPNVQLDNVDIIRYDLEDKPTVPENQKHAITVRLEYTVSTSVFQFNDIIEIPF